MRTTKICFDVDGTLITFDDKPRKDVIDMLKALYHLGCEIYMWSGGGHDYASMWMRKLGLTQYVTEVILYKDRKYADYYQIDICFDDEDVNLCPINIQINA